jgi:hypothetical protein
MITKEDFIIAVVAAFPGVDPEAPSAVGMSWLGGKAGWSTQLRVPGRFCTVSVTIVSDGSTYLWSVDHHGEYPTLAEAKEHAERSLAFQLDQIRTRQLVYKQLSTKGCV